jgi:coatomer subunit delta
LVRILKQDHFDSVHIIIKESISLSLSREGGLESLELKGDMNLHVSDPSFSQIKISLIPPPSALGPELQFKQHPNVGKFSANKERTVALKDPSRVFPVNQPLAVLKWRYTGRDESYVPLSSECNRILPSPLIGPDLNLGSQLLANAFQRWHVRCQHRI